MWMAGARGLKRANIANGRLYCPIHNVKQQRTFSSRPQAGNDDAELHCRDANSIRVFFHTSTKLASNGREAMSLLSKMSSLPKRGRRSAERRTNGCRASMRRRSRGPIRGPLAFRRSSAVMRREPDSAWAALPGIAGCKREDPLRHQCSEHLAVRHAPDGLMPKPPAG